MKNRDVDLIIKDEEHMQYLITFLVNTLKTIDGNKNSSLVYADQEKSMEQTIKKYRLMKFRMKISCIAYEKLKPINQLIIESQKLKDGNLESEISINATNELFTLSNNFISMRNSVKSNIYELNNTKELFFL